MAGYGRSSFDSDEEDPIDSFWDFSKEFKRKPKIEGAIGNRLKVEKEVVIPIEREVEHDTEYAKEFIKKENEMMLQSSLNMPGNVSAKSLDDVSDPGDDGNVDAADKIMTEIYSRYSFNLPMRSDLPIYVDRKEIVNTIEKHPVTIITSDTGNGKTTQVPQYILEDCYQKHKNCNIIITQPRKIAAITIAQRVALERRCEIGSLVGYQVGLHKKLDMTSHETRILYCTTGVLLQKLISMKNMNTFTHVIVDEVHERDADMDFVLLVIRRYMNTVSPNTKIILMSATINPKIFSEYFKTIHKSSYKCAPVLELKGHRNYKICISYLDSLARKIKLEESIINYNCPGISDEMYNLARKVVAFLIKQCEQDTNATNKPTFLVFLPGIYEIETFEKFLNDENLKGQSSNIRSAIKIFVLHSSLSADDQKAAFARCDSIKIILATNIAESSITIPEVSFVIDFCLTKYLFNDSTTNLSKLDLKWTSRNSCNQRAGRTGRVCDGYVYRMVHREFYERNMSESCIPEIKRCPLENIVLKSKMLEIGDPVSILALAVDPPKKSDILNSILLLKEVGALVRLSEDGTYYREDGEITYMGKIMAALPLNVRLSKLIVMGYCFSVLNETIMIAAGLNLKSIFKQDYVRKLDAYSFKLGFADSSGSDCIAILNAYKNWATKMEQGHLRDPKIERNWCNGFLLEMKSLHDMRQLINEIEHRLERFNMKEFAGGDRVQWTDNEKAVILKVCMAGAFYPNYFLRSTNDESIERSIYTQMNCLDPRNTVYFTGNNHKFLTELYEDVIKEKFVESGVCLDKDNINVIFDRNSSKIFVSFANDKYMISEHCDNSTGNVSTGKVAVEVYKSLKLKRVSKGTFTLRVMDEQRAQIYAEQMGLGTYEDGIFKFTTHFMKYPELCVIPSLFTKKMKGIVTHIEHCNKFFIRPIEESYDKIWIQLNENMKKCVKKMTVEKNNFESKSNVIVRYQNGLYRGRFIKYLTGAKTREIFSVYLIDVGKRVSVDFQDIYTENEECNQKNIFKYPPRIFESTLCSIQPSFINCPDGKWTMEAIAFFMEEVLEMEVNVEVYSVVNDVVSVTLTKAGENINDLMVNQKYAQYCEENYNSKLDHDMRIQNVNIDKKYKFNPEVEFAKRIDPNVKREIVLPGPEQHRAKLQLSGPFSPLETSINSCGRLNYKHKANLDPNSVHSIILETAVQERHEKMFVAADVGETRNNEIVIHEVTEMPSIPGLAVLMTLLFCPTMEMRRNKDCTRYTTILAGLGYDPTTRQPYFAEHDFALNIDVELDGSDLELIQHLRYMISNLLFTENHADVPMLNQKSKVSLLMTIKDDIIKLLEKERSSLSLEYTDREMDWGITDIKEVKLYKDYMQGRGLLSPLPFPEVYPVSEDVRDYMREHSMDLQHISNSFGKYKPVTCKFCDFSPQSITELRLHLLSKMHYDRVKRLLD